MARRGAAAAAPLLLCLLALASLAAAPAAAAPRAGRRRLAQLVDSPPTPEECAAPLYSKADVDACTALGYPLATEVYLDPNPPELNVLVDTLQATVDTNTTGPAVRRRRLLQRPRSGFVAAPGPLGFGRAEAYAETFSYARRKLLATGLALPFPISGPGAVELPQNDDSYSSVIALPSPLNLFGRNRTSVYVNNNGLLSFNAGVSTFTPTLFTGSTSNPSIAPFWAGGCA